MHPGTRLTQKENQAIGASCLDAHPTKANSMKF